MRVVELELPAPDYRLRPSVSVARHVKGFLRRDYQMAVKKALAKVGYPQPYFSSALVAVTIYRRKVRFNRNPDNELAWLKPMHDALTFERPNEMNPHGHIAVWLPEARVRTEIIAVDSLEIKKPYLLVRIKEHGLHRTPD